MGQFLKTCTITLSDVAFILMMMVCVVTYNDCLWSNFFASLTPKARVDLVSGSRELPRPVVIFKMSESSACDQIRKSP